MKSFQFPLAQVLHWRRLQLELEENKLKRLTAALVSLDRAGAELEAAAIQAEMQTRSCAPLKGRDLSALAGFRVHVQNRERALAAQRAECQKEIVAQQRALMEARRRYRLLERLKDRRLRAWQRESDREIERLAAESYLAGLARRRS